jgi:tRNA A-37 threonylcarbamoyl transferase component Bud32
MPASPPPRRCVDGAEEALRAATALGRAFARGGPEALAGSALPPGWRVVKARPMRAVLAGPGGAAVPGGVFAKAHRAPGLAERVKGRMRPPRGPAEGAALETLAARGLPVAEPIAWAAEGPGGADVLVTRAVAGARPLEGLDADALPHRERKALAEALGRLLRAAHDAGWRARDLHRGNVVLSDAGPVLVDVGSHGPGGSIGAARRAALLGAAGHGLSASARDAFRALRAYAGGDAAEARRWMVRAVPASRLVARLYRRRRTRRARRTGLHFEAFEAGPLRGIRSTGSSPASWRAACRAWVEGDPPGARPMKAGGGVVAARLPDRAGDVVLKRWGPSWKDRFRVPRALRAFRTAYALRVRGVACPEPLLAAADAAGRGVLVSERAGGPGAEAVDLHRAAVGAGAGPSALSTLARAERTRALEKLGRFLRRMHDAEVVHRDLKAPNLVAWRCPAGPAFAVVDLEGARATSGPVPWARRARDVARLDASLPRDAVSRADRLRVVRGYFASFERLRPGPGDFARAVDALAARKRAAVVQSTRP